MSHPIRLLNFTPKQHYRSPTVADADERRDLPQEPQPAHPLPGGGESAACREAD